MSTYVHLTAGDEVPEGNPEEYPLTLTAEEAKYLQTQLIFLGRNSTDNRPANTIRRKLNYRGPMFPVGTKVVRIKSNGEPVSYDTKVYEVVGHVFVSPGNWTAWLDDGFGVGECYLRLAPEAQEEADAMDFLREHYGKG